LLSLGFDIPQVAPANAAEDAEFNRVLNAVDPNSLTVCMYVFQGCI
jgi:hypothetical protein